MDSGAQGTTALLMWSAQYSIRIGHDNSSSPASSWTHSPKKNEFYWGENIKDAPGKKLFDKPWRRGKNRVGVKFY